MQAKQPYQQQLKLINKASLKIKKTRIPTTQNTSNIAHTFDIGGTKVGYQKTSLQNNKVLTQDERQIDDLNITQYIKQKINDADSNDSIGISIAAMVQNDKVKVGINLDTRLIDQINQLNQHFSRKNIYIYNDALAGVAGSVSHLQSLGEKVSNLIFIINGSGLGGAIYAKGSYYQAEPGHYPIISRLNPFNRTTICEQTPTASFTCAEKIASGVAGIQDTWTTTLNHNPKPANEILSLVNSAPQAKKLVLNSANVTAHTIIGTANAMDIDLNDKTSHIVYHGGLFKNSWYTQQTTQFLHQYGYQTSTITTPTENLCLSPAIITNNEP